MASSRVSPAALPIASDAPAAAELLAGLTSGTRRSRSVLLKHPSRPTPPSWHLCLPPHFNTALGLKFAAKQQVKNKEVVRTWREWTQSGNFCFNEGSIIYDRDVSALPTWREKLDTIETFVVLGSAKPVTIKTQEQPRSGQKKTRDPGSVLCKIFTASPTHGIVMINEASLTQDQFVRFAIMGIL